MSCVQPEVSTLPPKLLGIRSVIFLPADVVPHLVPPLLLFPPPFYRTRQPSISSLLGSLVKMPVRLSPSTSSVLLLLIIEAEVLTKLLTGAMSGC